jgi:hypothetical protein
MSSGRACQARRCPLAGCQQDPPDLVVTLVLVVSISAPDITDLKKKNEFGQHHECAAAANFGATLIRIF